MAKKLERIRKLLSLFILVTFFLETTVFAQVQLVRSVLPVRSVSTKPIYSPASSIPTVTTAPSTPSASPLPPVATTPAAASTVAASSATQVAPPAIAIVRLSLSSDDEQGDRASQAASSNGDGRWVAFDSQARNLVPGDTNHKLDIFVRDELSGETFRVSVASDGAEANNDSVAPSISADGRYVAFESKASNLVPGDTRGSRDRRDIFVHDTVTGETVRVSVASDGTQANKDSTAPSISADGRFVAFESRATNLVPGSTNAKKQIFVHDRDTGETTLASLSTDNMVGNKTSSEPAISGDGRFVAFQLKATNLVPFDTNDKQDVFVHDRETGETTRVSVANDGSLRWTGTGGAPAEISRDEGGPFSCFGDRIVGRQVELVPDRRIVQAWRAADWEDGVYSVVRFELREDGKGTRLVFDQSGFPQGEKGHLEAGWPKMYWEPLQEFLT